MSKAFPFPSLPLLLPPRNGTLSGRNRNTQTVLILSSQRRVSFLAWVCSWVHKRRCGPACRDQTGFGIGFDLAHPSSRPFTSQEAAIDQQPFDRAVTLSSPSVPSYNPLYPSSIVDMSTVYLRISCELPSIHSLRASTQARYG